MKWFSCSILLCLFVVSGCAHSPDAASSVLPSASPRPEEEPLPPPGADSRPAGPPGGAGDTTRKRRRPRPHPPGSRQYRATQALSTADYVEEGGDREERQIADPLEPFNRAMYHFNDKLYFWVLKPVAQGYKAIVPEVARIGVGNFFTNIAFPIRFVNCLLQANFKGAAGRSAVSCSIRSGGSGGFLDPASHEDVGLAKQDEDFGQTLGVYGVGQGFYINWPILGPSSPRDTLGTVGDYFTHPLFYYDGPWLIPWGLWAYDKVNDTSLRIGDYESLKEAAIDPYVAIRDAYVQYRLNKVKER